MITKIDRYRGALAGLAVGDALGATVEFQAPGTFPRLTKITGGGPFNLKSGEWTDDTSMALCLAASLIECDRFDPKDQMNRYLDWRDNGYMSSRGKGGKCLDIGNTTSASIDRFIETGNPYSGSEESNSAGNGSIMRLVPVPLFYAGNPCDAINFSQESSKTTHANINCVEACFYMAAIINGAVNGLSKQEILSSEFMSDIVFKSNIRHIANGSFKEKEPPDIQGTGYVVDTLEAALWAFNKYNTFEEGLIEVVNLGDDADTTGAVYGQIAGVYYGIDAIPERWLEKIVDLDGIMYIAETLYDSAIERYGIEFSEYN